MSPVAGSDQVPPPRPVTGRSRSAQAATAPALRLVPGMSAGAGPRSSARPTVAASDGYRIATDKLLFAVVVALCAVGTVMVLSASAYTSLVDYGSVWSIFVRQVLWMAVAAVVLAAFARFPYQRLRRFRTVLLVGTIVLLLAVLVPGVGDTAGGSSRWIGFGQLRIQPSEVMNLALALFAADLVARRSDRIHRTGAVVVPLMLVLGFSALLVLLQPDLGTAIVLGCVVFGCLFAGGVPWRTVVTWIGGSLLAVTMASMVSSYRRARLLSFINPMAHSQGSGYQVVQSLVGLGSGGLFGVGLGNGQAKWGLLPNPHTDFIFSVIGQETGLFGTLVVIALFAVLAVAGFRVAGQATDRFGMLLATAITCWITAEAAINVGAVIGVLPVTGIPLPYVSFGGSSLVVIMAATGILLNIARSAQSRHRQDVGSRSSRRVGR
jgi:cell division protein FtsW